MAYDFKIDSVVTSGVQGTSLWFGAISGQADAAPEPITVDALAEYLEGILGGGGGGSGNIQDLLDGLSTTQGAVIYRGATDWEDLAPGSSGQVLTSGGAGQNPTWEDAAESGLTVGATAIASGTDTRILYDNAGVLGEYTLTGTGNVVAMATAPTFVTSITTPSVLATANDSGALGASGTAFADLFLASGGVIDWNAGNFTLTHSAGLLTANAAITATTLTATTSVVIGSATLTGPSTNLVGWGGSTSSFPALKRNSTGIDVRLADDSAYAPLTASVLTATTSLTVPTLTITQGTITDVAPNIDASVTWNDAADTFTAWKLNVTDTASAAASLLLDLQIGSSSNFKVGKHGYITVKGEPNVNASTFFSTGAGTAGVGMQSGYGVNAALGNITFIQPQGDPLFGATTAMLWTSGSIGIGQPYASGQDLILSRFAAATLQLGQADANTPVAQTLKAQSGLTGSGSDIGGPDFSISPGLGTGFGTTSTYGLGRVLFKTPVQQATGATIQTYATAAAIGPQTITSATSNPVLDLNQTWNNAGLTATAIKLNVTSTASAAASLLMDLQVGGSTMFSLNKAGVAIFAAGAVGAPSITFGDATSGIYRRSSGEINIAGGGVESIRVQSSGLVQLTQGVLQFGSSADFQIRRISAAVGQLGAADANIPVAQTLKVQSGLTGSGSDIGGPDFTIQCGLGTGFGTTSTYGLGRVLFSTPVQKATGATIQTYATAAAIGPQTITSATSNPVLDLNQTWNNAGLTATGIKLNVTDTSSNSNSLLLDLQVGGSSEFYVRKDGTAFVTNHLGAPSGSSLYLFANGYIFGGQVNIQGDKISFPSGLQMGWTNDSTSYGTRDIGLSRSAAGVLEVNNGTIGTFRDIKSRSVITPMTGELTIASDAITVTGSYHRVDTQSDAASDDLSTINGGVDGMRLVLRAENTARTVVVKDGVGNIQCVGDMSLDNTQDTIELIYDGTLTAWLEICRSDSGA